MAPHILIADDEEDVLLLCRVNLEFEGFTVTEASNGQEALDKARQSHPDLVLLDVMMPVKDGWECLAELQADPDLKEVPVVMLTAKVQEEHQLRGLASGASDYVTKPFHPSALVNTVRTVLDAPSEEREKRRQEALKKLELFRRL
jgi:two-component system, OmpR family, alkaline phosphatase synthesis response regulator PhoP